MAWLWWWVCASFAIEPSAPDAEAAPVVGPDAEAATVIGPAAEAATVVGQAARGPRWEDIFASGDGERLRALAHDVDVPPELRLQAALILLRRARTPEASQVVEVPTTRDDVACDKEGKVVRRVPVPGLATLQELTVESMGDHVLVRGRLDGAAGRPLHYLVEGGSATFPSRYVVSMLGVRSALDNPRIEVDSHLVRNVQVIERDGAMIVVVNSVEERALRVDFQQNGDAFTIALRVAHTS